MLTSKLKELNRLGEGNATLTAKVRDGKLQIALQHDAFGFTGDHPGIEEAVTDLLQERQKIDFALKNFADLISQSVHPDFAKALRQ